MHVVDDQVETIHVYMVREEDKQPPLFLPLCVALVCLAVIMSVTMYSGSHPAYEHDTLTIPARFLPPQTFMAGQAIVPTGIKTYPATTAQGTLTVTNGSVETVQMPSGMIFTGKDGLEAITDTTAYVPAGSADGYGRSTVSAHLLTPGINMSALDIDQVVGTSLYVRNLQPFTGGHPAYSVKYATAQDKQTALLHARDILLNKSIGVHNPCVEDHVAGTSTMIVTWRCQFVQPPQLNIPNARITGMKLLGKNLLVDVLFIAPPKQWWAK